LALGGWHRPTPALRKLISAVRHASSRNARGCFVERDHTALAIQHDCSARQTNDKLLDQQGLRSGKCAVRCGRGTGRADRSCLTDQSLPRAAQPARQATGRGKIAAVVVYRQDQSASVFPASISLRIGAVTDFISFGGHPRTFQIEPYFACAKDGQSNTKGAI
jgi:hypothetical protein